MIYKTVRLGDYIKQVDNRNRDNKYSIKDLRGVDKNKKFIRTVANTTNLNLINYKVIQPEQFVYSGMQTGRDECIRVSLNTGSPVIVSPAYTVFEVKDTNDIVPSYLMMLLSTPEIDRIGWFKSDSSVRANLDWERFCEITITLPPAKKQLEYIEVYGSLQKIIDYHELSFSHLQLVADLFMEKLQKHHDLDTIGGYVREVGARNKDKQIVNQVGLENKDFVAPKVKVADDKYETYKVIQKNQFACNLMHVGRDLRLPVGLYSNDDPAIISPAYKIFEVSQPEKLLPEFLLLFFKRSETDRLMAYMTDSSIRQGLDWDRLCEVKMPIPPIAVQESIVTIYHALEMRKQITEQLKETFNVIGPILIKDAKDKVGTAL